MTLFKRFNDVFECLEADTPQLIHDSLRLRYQVYCSESGYFPENEDHIETDAFDNMSIHYLIRHIRTGNYVATCRLVILDPDSPSSTFPYEEYSTIDYPVKKNRLKMAELSRLSVSAKFKKENELSNDELNLLPQLLLALFSCGFKTCLERGIDNICGAMEAKGLRFADRVGLLFIPVGPKTNYHGVRWPCLSPVLASIDNMNRVNPDGWTLLTGNGQYLKSTEEN